MKYLLFVSSLVLAVNINNAFAEDEVASIPYKSAEKMVEDVYNGWRKIVSNKLISNCEAKKIDLNAPECDFATNITFGEAHVKVNSNNPKWVDARSMAYTEALVNAYAKVAQEQNITNQVSIIKELIDDQKPLDPGELKAKSKLGVLWDKAVGVADSVMNEQLASRGVDPNEMSPDIVKAKSQLETLWDKALAMADGFMNKKLETLGVNTEEYAQAPLEKKKTLLRSAITERSVSKALADTTGMIPLQTFEGNNGNGEYVIRVAISKSPKRVSLIKSMLRNRASVPADPQKKASKTVDEQVIASDDILFNQFGTRLIYDKEGFPVLISYGQAGVAAGKNDFMRDVKREAAQADARKSAENGLTNLLNSSTVTKSVLDKVSQKSQEMKVVIDKAGSTEELFNEADFNRSLHQTTTTNAQITNFAGIRELHNWSYIHPTLGYEVVGTILMWSPKTAAHAKGISTVSSVTPADYKPEDPNAKMGVETDDYDF